MLNTVAVKKYNNKNNTNNSLSTIAEETLIEEGIRKIAEKTNDGVITEMGIDNNAFDQIDSLKNKNIFAFKENEVQPTYHELVGGINDNFSSGKIQDEGIRESIISDNNNKKLMVTINDKLMKISVFDDKNNLIGYFTIEHIIKYLGNIYDTKQQFLKDIDPDTYKKAKELIKRMIFKLNYNKKDKYTDIILYDYTKSGFMGDVELLVKLNDLLYKYQTQHLQNYLSKVEIHDRVKIEQNIRKFIFILLNYTLKLISVISDKIKDNTDKKDLKEKLLNYSISTNYKINLFVQEQLKIIHNQNKVVKDALDTNLKIKQEIKNNLDQLIKNIQSQTQPHDSLSQAAASQEPQASQSSQVSHASHASHASQHFTPSIIKRAKENSDRPVSASSYYDF